MSPYVILAGIVLLTLLGDYFLKVASGMERSFYTLEFVLGAAFYTSTAVGWLLVMRHMSLATIGVFYSVLTILLLAALGTVVFRETLTGREILGIVLAFASLGLMSRLT